MKNISPIHFIVERVVLPDFLMQLLPYDTIVYRQAGQEKRARPTLQA